VGFDEKNVKSGDQVRDRRVQAELKVLEIRRSVRDQAHPSRETFRDILCQSSGQLPLDLIQTQTRSNHQ
jgi:hypothetical protein